MNHVAAHHGQHAQIPLANHLPTLHTPTVKVAHASSVPARVSKSGASNSKKAESEVQKTETPSFESEIAAAASVDVPKPQEKATPWTKLLSGFSLPTEAEPAPTADTSAPAEIKVDLAPTPAKPVAIETKPVPRAVKHVVARDPAPETPRTPTEPAKATEPPAAKTEPKLPLPEPTAAQPLPVLVEPVMPIIVQTPPEPLKRPASGPPPTTPKDTKKVAESQETQSPKQAELALGMEIREKPATRVAAAPASSQSPVSTRPTPQTEAHVTQAAPPPVAHPAAIPNPQPAPAPPMSTPTPIYDRPTHEQAPPATPATSLPPTLPEKQDPTQPIRNFSLEFTPDGAKDIRLHVTQHAGDVHVSLHSTDPQLTGKLRDGVQDLIGGLDQAGYDATAWNPQDGQRRRQPDPEPEAPRPPRRPAEPQQEFANILQDKEPQ